MKYRDLLATEAGEWLVCQPAREWDLLCTPYRFHRFLTEVEDALEAVTNEIDVLPRLSLLVRRLITNSYWIQNQYVAPNPETGVGVTLLYDEIGYPLTVQIATYLPGTQSTIHNHGNWAVIAVLKGEEKNTFWKRTPDPCFPDWIEPRAEVMLLPGDIISFAPEAIHSIEAMGHEPTVTFGIYGETYHSRRFEFNSMAHTAKTF